MVENQFFRSGSLPGCNFNNVHSFRIAFQIEPLRLPALTGERLQRSPCKIINSNSIIFHFLTEIQPGTISGRIWVESEIEGIICLIKVFARNCLLKSLPDSHFSVSKNQSIRRLPYRLTENKSFFRNSSSQGT